MIEIKLPCKIGIKVLIDRDFYGYVTKYEVRGWASPFDERLPRVYAIVENQDKQMMVAVYDGKFPDNVKIAE